MQLEEFTQELIEELSGPIYIGEESFPIFCAKCEKEGLDCTEEFRKEAMRLSEDMYQDFLNGKFDAEEYFAFGAHLEFLDLKLEAGE